MREVSTEDETLLRVESDDQVLGGGGSDDQALVHVNCAVDVLLAVLVGMRGAERAGAKWEGSKLAVWTRLRALLSKDIEKLARRCPNTTVYVGCKTDAMAGKDQ